MSASAHLPSLSVTHAAASRRLGLLWVLSYIAGAAFVWAAMLKLRPLLGGESLALLPLVAVFAAIVELSIGLAIIARPASLLCNGMACFLLFCAAVYHGVRIVGGVQTPCGCFGAWSPPSWMILAIALPGGALLCISGPTGAWLMAVAARCFGVQSDWLFPSEDRKDYSLGRTRIFLLSSAGMALLAALLLAHQFIPRTYPTERGLRFTSTELVAKDVGRQAEEALSRLDLLDKDGLVLFVRSSCGECQQLLDEIALARLKNPTEHSLLHLVVLDLDGAIATPVLDGAFTVASPRGETINLPAVPMLCKVENGKIMSLTESVTRENILSDVE